MRPSVPSDASLREEVRARQPGSQGARDASLQLPAPQGLRVRGGQELSEHLQLPGGGIRDGAIPCTSAPIWTLPDIAIMPLTCGDASGPVSPISSGPPGSVGVRGSSPSAPPVKLQVTGLRGTTKALFKIAKRAFVPATCQIGTSRAVSWPCWTDLRRLKAPPPMRPGIVRGRSNGAGVCGRGWTAVGGPAVWKPDGDRRARRASSRPSRIPCFCSISASLRGHEHADADLCLRQPLQHGAGGRS